MGAAAGIAAPAQAQLLPQMGAPVELGDLRRTFEQAYGPVGIAPGQPAWTITPAIDLEFMGTNDARALGTRFGQSSGGAGATRRGSEFVTTVTPSLLIQGASQRLTGSLSYAPSLNKYLNDSRQDSISQNLNGQARATIFEDLLFLNASAYVAEYSRGGGLSQGAGRPISRQDRVRTTNFSFGPQLRHAFGDWGSIDLGYTFALLTRSGQGLRQNTPFTSGLSPGNTTTNTYVAGFTSGQEFGRINFGLNVQRIDYNGVGALKNAYRQSEILDLGYAVTRGVTLLGQIGHQDIRYGGLRPIRVNDVLWSVGVRWNPDPDTTMTVRYGYRDGGSNFYFDGATAPTARTRVSLSYSEAMVSTVDELQASLGRTTLGASGVAIDAATGMPVLVNNNFAGAQGGVARVRRISTSGVLLRDLDTVTLSFNRDERITLSAEVPGAPPSSTYYNAALAWQRELMPGVRGNAQVSYGERLGTRVTQDILTVSTGVTWSLSETLSTRATYTYTRAASSQAAFSYDASLVSVGLRKSF